jgi:sugar transferase EpsL
MYNAAKRSLDVTLAVIGLLFLSPLLAIVAIAVRLNLGSPVLFRQVRPGYQGRLFTLIKFRTMRDTRDALGKLLPDADRLTSLGSWLRRLSLDEFPELWNVLRGDMSLVGPRPLLTQYLKRYTLEQARRHEVKPGITGWAQINGRNGLTWDRKFQLDLWYVDHHSLALDAQILVRTFWKALKSQGVSQEGHATMPEFKGTVNSEP